MDHPLKVATFYKIANATTFYKIGNATIFYKIGNATTFYKIGDANSLIHGHEKGGCVTQNLKLRVLCFRPSAYGPGSTFLLKIPF